jgi:hypothetical protein
VQELNLDENRGERKREEVGRHAKSSYDSFIGTEEIFFTFF